MKKLLAATGITALIAAVVGFLFTIGKKMADMEKAGCDTVCPAFIYKQTRRN